jgi:hypothetical protein
MAVPPRPRCVDRLARPRSRRRLRLYFTAFFAAPLILSSACAGPAAPLPPPPPSTQPPPPPPPPPNAAPVIASITAPVARAEVNEPIVITAKIEDAETAADKLTYTWEANAGTFSGAGPAVTWRLEPGATQTPIDLKVTLTVTEPYDALQNGQLVKLEHKVVREVTLTRVHDSRAELSAMTLRFLIDLFGNSSVRPEQCVVDFSNSCPGKFDELDDIEDNRSEFLILSASARIVNVALDAARTSASVDAQCSFRDRKLPGGKEGVSEGMCRFTAVYEQRRWWLCSSHFEGSCGSCATPSRLRRMTMREFFLAGHRDR